MARSLRLCTAKKCDRKHYGRGLCAKHYMYAYRHHQLPPRTPAAPRTLTAPVPVPDLDAYLERLQATAREAGWTPADEQPPPEAEPTDEFPVTVSYVTPATPR